MKAKLVFVMLLVCVIAVASVLFSIFYMRLSPAHANEFEEAFYCGTTNESWMYTGDYLAENIDSTLLEKHEAGRVLFRDNCAVCHGMRDVVVGPGLAGVTQRRDSTWLFNFIRNSEKMVAEGDTSAVKLSEEFNNQQMPSFPFSDYEIAEIIGYLNLYKVQL